ncbi:MAG: putative lipid II flippase FtsW [Proteobacteria bacterium]|nr:putative lipid II flippase FtsW [Pseudomonadota bacterium]
MPEAVKKQNWDYILLLSALCLTGLGLVMLFSASSIMAEKRFGDAYYFLRPQTIYVLAGLGVMLLIKNIPYQFFTRLSPVILLMTVVALALVLVPGLSAKAGGASRWLRVGPVTFQPSEAAKVALVLHLAFFLAARPQGIRSFTGGLLPHLIVLGLMVVMILAEPDLGTAAILCLLALILFFVGGARMTHLFGLALLAAPAVYFLIVRYPYRIRRILAFTRPWDDPLDTGYHIIHSFLAFASGGLTGLGPGGGRQKLFFLPECHTDFIFSVIGEELGLVGVAFVAFLFLVLVWRGIAVALDAYELEGTYLALGMTMIIGLQAFLNMAVVVGLVPTKGLALPFFSYGGSAMLVNFAALGMIMNVAAQERPRS